VAEVDAPTVKDAGVNVVSHSVRERVRRHNQIGRPCDARRRKGCQGKVNKYLGGECKQ